MSLALDEGWVALALGASGAPGGAAAPEASDEEAAATCENQTEAGALLRALKDPLFDPTPGVLGALGGRGLHARGPGCAGLWGLAALYSAERLAEVLLPSLAFAEPAAREAALLQPLRHRVLEAQGLFEELPGAPAAPFRRRLLRLAAALRARPLWAPRLPPARLRSKANGTGALLALFCGRMSAEPLQRAAARHGWTFRHVVPAVRAARPDAEVDAPGEFGPCMRAYEAAARAEAHRFQAVLLWSPLAWAWEALPNVLAERFAAIDGLARVMPARNWSIVGFPSLAQRRGGRLRGTRLVWPVRRLRWEHWKLEYFQGPTGHLGMAHGCFRGDSTSGTRLVAMSVVAAARSARGSAWLTALDLAARRSAGGPGAHTCPDVVLYEGDWLPWARLGRSFSVAHGVEAARWLPRPQPTQEHCLALSGDAARHLVFAQGVTTPWCFRRQLHAVLRSLAGWWRRRAPGNALVPLQGTLLGILRGGAPMPWDHDADLVFVSRAEFQFRAHLDAIQAELAALGCTLRVGSDAPEGFVTAEARCVDAAGVDVAIDAYWQGGAQEPELRLWAQQSVAIAADFLGEEVWMDMNEINRLAQEPRYQPKLATLQTGLVPLQCLAPGHNACLPDCRDRGADCEYPDSFVLVDSWWPE